MWRAWHVLEPLVYAAAGILWFLFVLPFQFWAVVIDEARHKVKGD